jgi:Protein of unknown function (DUF3489)
MSKPTKSKSAKKRTVAVTTTPASDAKPAQTTAAVPKNTKAEPTSKQSRVIAMLQSPTGTTIAAMMKTTGWQQHSVRGFLAGVVRKRLKLRLSSKKVDGNRVYQIVSRGGGKSGAREAQRASA